MQKGYNVLLCDVDIIFLRNPFLFFDYSLDIQGTILFESNSLFFFCPPKESNLTFSLGGVHKSEKITGGFIFFRATESAKKLWMKVLTMVSIYIIQKTKQNRTEQNRTKQNKTKQKEKSKRLQ